MFPSLSQRGMHKVERTSRALALGDSISSFQYDFKVDDDNDDDSMTGVSFADETSISNLDEIFQRSCAIGVSIPDHVSSSLRNDYGSLASTNQDGSSFEVWSPFGVHVDDLFWSFDEHLNAQGSNSTKVFKKRHRSRRRGFGSSHGCSRHCSDVLQPEPAFLSPKSDGQSSWNEDATDQNDDDDIYVQLRGKSEAASFDYLPATRQQSLRHALSERFARPLIGSPPSVSRQGKTVRRRTQEELKAALLREFGVKFEASIRLNAKSDDRRALPVEVASPLHHDIKNRRERLQRIASLRGAEVTYPSPARAFPSAV